MREKCKKQQKKNKTKAERSNGNRSYSERVRAKWFCCAFKLGFLQLICKASLIFKSNMELALSIIFWYFYITTNFNFRIFIFFWNSNVNVCVWIYINMLHFNCGMILKSYIFFSYNVAFKVFINLKFTTFMYPYFVWFVIRLI